MRVGGSEVVRERAAPVRLSLRAEVDAAAPLEPGEDVLIDWRIKHGGDWLPRVGWLRVTDRRVVILAGRWLARNRVIEVPRSLVRVGHGGEADIVVRLEVAAPIDEDLLAFRSSDLFVRPAPSGLTLAVRQDSMRTRQLRELLVLALGEAPADPA